MTEVVRADLHLEAVLGQRLGARHHARVVHQDVDLLFLQQQHGGFESILRKKSKLARKNYRVSHPIMQKGFSEKF